VDIKPIRTEADYEEALARVESLMDAKAGTAEGDELDLLATLVESYEKGIYDIPMASPIAAIRFVMEQRGMKNKDLIPCIGHSGRVSEVLSGKRKLSIEMIRNLNRELDIPADNLIQEYEVVA